MPLNYNKKTPIFYTASVPAASKQTDDLFLETSGVRSPDLWRWDGTYWRSDAMKWSGSQNDTTSAMKLHLQLEPFYGFYLKSISVSYCSTAASSSTNYWGFQCFFSTTGFNNVGGILAENNWDSWTANLPGNYSAYFNNYLNLTTRQANFLTFVANRVGSAAAATMAFTATYELIRK